MVMRTWNSLFFLKGITKNCFQLAPTDESFSYKGNKSKPASKNPVDCCPFGANSNIIFLSIVVRCHLPMKIVYFSLQARMSLKGFYKFFLRHPDD